jgi:hypothetical protein
MLMWKSLLQSPVISSANWLTIDLLRKPLLEDLFFNQSPKSKNLNTLTYARTEAQIQVQQRDF